MRLRPPRHARPLPGVRDGSKGAGCGRSGGAHMRRSSSLPALLARFAVLSCFAMAAVSIVLWIASSRRSIGIFSLGSSIDLRVLYGVADVRHFYEYDFAPPVPADQWHFTAVSRGWVLPPSMR